MKKYLLDLTVRSVERIHERYVLMKLTDETPLPEMLPGQFVEIRVDGSPTTFLRRPISINFVDTEANELWLLVAAVGDGTRRLAEMKAGDKLNCLLPLGNGFTMPQKLDEKILLVGGGVGVAPLLYMGAQMVQMGCEPTFLLGARTAKDLLMLDVFRKYGRVCVTTEDGSEGDGARTVLPPGTWRQSCGCGTLWQRRPGRMALYRQQCQPVSAVPQRKAIPVVPRHRHRSTAPRREHRGSECGILQAPQQQDEIKKRVQA